MLSRVLFPTDRSRRACGLVSLMGGLIPRPEHVSAATVVEISGLEQPIIEEHVTHARDELDDLIEPLRSSGIPVDTHVLTGPPAASLVRLITESRCDSVIIGSYGKDPVAELLGGSVSAHLTRHTRTPVVHVRFGALSGKGEQECRALGARLMEAPLCPIDDSARSREALASLVDFAHSRPNRIRLVSLAHVIDDAYSADDGVREETHRFVGEAAERLRAAGLPTEVHVVDGDPVAELTRMAYELDSSCVVMGTQGKGLIREAFAGSVSQGVLRMAGRPVVVMR